MVPKNHWVSDLDHSYNHTNEFFIRTLTGNKLRRMIRKSKFNVTKFFFTNGFQNSDDFFFLIFLRLLCKGKVKFYWKFGITSQWLCNSWAVLPRPKWVGLLIFCQIYSSLFVRSSLIPHPRDKSENLFKFFKAEGIFFFFFILITGF